MINLSKTYDTATSLIYYALVMVMIYSWIKIKLKSANLSINPKTLLYTL
jgi:hypothetical protein